MLCFQASFFLVWAWITFCLLPINGVDALWNVQMMEKWVWMNSSGRWRGQHIGTRVKFCMVLIAHPTWNSLVQGVQAMLKLQYVCRNEVFLVFGLFPFSFWRMICGASSFVCFTCINDAMLTNLSCLFLFRPFIFYICLWGYDWIACYLCSKND